MAHIHTQPGQHDLTVSAFIVRGGRLLLHRHKTMGVLMQPGGHVELNEDPWHAVAHEMAEETGYALTQVRVLQPPVRVARLDMAVVHPEPFCVATFEVANRPQHLHTDLAYAFVTDEPPLGVPGVGESTALRWVTRADLATLPPRETFENVRQLGLFVFDELMTAWRAVSTGVWS